jgi:hypothetical protein
VSGDPLEQLREAEAVADPAKRQEAAVAATRALLMARPDEFTRELARAEAKRSGVMPLGMFDAIAREVRTLTLPPPVAAARMPDNALEVPGSAGCCYVPYDSPDDPGEVLEARGKDWRRLLPWAPEVPRTLVAPNDEGETLCRYYEIRAGGDSAVASAEELVTGEIWRRFPVPGTGSKRVREILANIVLAEAQALTPAPALTHTGWHAAEDGKRFYVFADGRASDRREVHLIGAESSLRLAAAPVVPDPGAVAAAIRAIAEHGRGPALAALGIGARSLGHSLHKVLGGFLFVGPRNSGKSSAAWHGRTMLIARHGRVNAWPPVPSALFTATPARLETDLDFEGDMPSLLDDAALNAQSRAADEARVTAALEQVFRPLANDTAVRPRSSRTLAPQESRYVRSPVMATLQRLPGAVDPSLKRRALILPVQRGDLDVLWYRDQKAGDVVALVRPLRTLGEHLLIPWLAALGNDAAAYLAARDAEALELLRPALDEAAPGWETSDEGLAGVADLGAAALAGLLIIAAVTPGLDVAEVTPAAVAYLARCVAAQGDIMTDEAGSESAAEAAAEILRAALLDGRAHVRNAQGVPWPAVPGLTEQEQGLEGFGGDDPIYRGRGVPVYWLEAEGAAGVSSEGLFKLLQAAHDPRIAVKTSIALGPVLVEAGGALPSDQKSSKGTHQKRVGGPRKRLIYLCPDVFFPSASNDVPGDPVHPVHPVQPSSDGDNRTGEPATPAVAPGTAQVGASQAPAVAMADDGGACSESAPDVLGTGCTGLPGTADDDSRPAAENHYAWPAESVGAAVNGAQAPAPRRGLEVPASGSPEVPERVLARAGMLPPAAAPVVPWLSEVRGYLADCRASVAPLNPKYHPTAEGAVKVIGHRADSAAAAAIREAFALEADVAEPPALEADVAEVPVSSSPDVGAEALGIDTQALAAEQLAEQLAQAPARSAPVPVGARGLAFLVLSAEGRAYGPDGEIVTLAPGWLEGVAHVGDLAALGLGLGARVLWIPRAVRELLGLPADLPALGKLEGYPHKFTEAADPAAWDVWPASPVGLSGWLTVYRMPTMLHEGLALAFPEWLPALGDGPQFADLAPADLAEALTLIWRATTAPGNGGVYGGAHFNRSPGATMRRLLGATSRRRRSGQLEASEIPPPYVRGKGSALGRVPGLHMAPALEVPAGYVLAELDVRSCFLSAAIGTDFGVGEAEHRTRPGSAEARMPGVHLLRAPAAAATIHPALWPILPPPRRGQAEVSAWVDTIGARLLADRGVPFTVAQSWVWPEPHGRRVFDSVAQRLGEARGALAAREGAPAAIAAAVVKAMYARTFGGNLASDFGGQRDPDDPWYRPDWWLTIRIQAEVRKQRNLLPAIAAGVLVLGEADIDTVFVAAPSPEALEAMPGTGGRPAIAEGRGKLAIKARAVVTPALAELLAGKAASPRARLLAIREALGDTEGAR